MITTTAMCINHARLFDYDYEQAICGYDHHYCHDHGRAYGHTASNTKTTTRPHTGQPLPHVS